MANTILPHFVPQIITIPSFSNSRPTCSNSLLRFTNYYNFLRTVPSCFSNGNKPSVQSRQGGQFWRSTCRKKTKDTSHLTFQGNSSNIFAMGNLRATRAKLVNFVLRLKKVSFMALTVAAARRRRVAIKARTKSKVHLVGTVFGVNAGEMRWPLPVRRA